MKKIVLSLFLVLAAVSFAIPSHIDTKKLENNAYQILQDEVLEGNIKIFIFGKLTEEAEIKVAIYEKNDGLNPKSLSQSIKDTAPESQKFLNSSENKRAYILKFSDQGGGYTYNFIAKNPKVKNYTISVLYGTDKNLSGTNLDKMADKVLNEIESFLK